MRRARNLDTHLGLLIATLGLLLPAQALAQSSTSSVENGDDTALFSAVVAPNVLLLIDNSGSMNHVVWHPEFDPRATPTCNKWSNTSRYFFEEDEVATFTSTEIAAGCTNTGRTIFIDPVVSAGDPSEPTRWSGRYLNWYHSAAADSYVADILATSNGTLSTCLQAELSPPYTYAKYKRSRMTAAKQILHDVICRANQSGSVRFGMARFEDGFDDDPQGGWIISEIDDYTAAHAADLDTKIDSLVGYAWTPLAETLFEIYGYFMSRTVADIPCGVIDEDCATVGTDPDVRFDLYDLDLSGNPITTGPLLADPMYDAVSGEYLTCRKNFVIILTDGEPSNDDFDGMDLTRFKTKLIGDYASDAADPYPENFNNPNGDPETLAYDATYHTEDSQGTYGHEDDINSNWETALYLDDIAKFMHDKDFRPDIELTQTIDVYTVGFSTSPYANAILEKAATNGGGEFYFSNNAEELAEAISSALSDIITKSQQFTAATVPASRASDGNAFYTSYFVPHASEFWEGHLKQFEFTGAGEIRDNQNPSECVLDDPNSTDPVTGVCQTGKLKLASEGFWDAADEVPSALETSGGRKLYTSLAGTTRTPGASVNVPTTFVEANIGADDVGLSTAEIAGGEVALTDYDGVDGFDLTAFIAGGGDNEDLADELVAYTRGCDFGSDPCDERGTTSAPRKLADIFHSNPVVVGSPNSTINHSTYRTFATNYQGRTKVIYAGSNGGFAHGFHTGEWRTASHPQVPNPPGYDRGTGEELMGFMSYAARDNLRELPLQGGGDKVYYMDGSPQVADVWLYPTATSIVSSWTEWHTVMLGGMRQGGRVVWAIDITDPDGDYSQPQYPGYLWEFPCEHSSCDSLRPLMGETWSDPVITRVRVKVNDAGPTGALGYDRWVAIFGAGYDECGDPHSLIYGETGTGEACENNVAGRAIFVVDITTGEVLAKKAFDASATTDYQSEMKYAFPSAPAVFDLDFNGYADVIYIGDLGGNLWKWVIDDVIEDAVNTSGTPDTDPAEWEFVRMLEAAPCPEGTNTDQCDIERRKSFFFPPTGGVLHGTLYLAWGSGERQLLSYLGDADTDLENNRYYMLKDYDPFETGYTTPTDTDPRYSDAAGSTDFVDVTNVTGCTPPVPPAVGYYFMAEDGEKFITNSVIFLGAVFTGSYFPSEPDTPCESGGTAYFYGFNLFCGEGILPPASGDENDPPERRMTIGTGVPNSPRVSIGPMDDQDDDDDCPNKALGLSSNGTVFGYSADCIPNQGVRVKSWRDE